MAQASMHGMRCVLTRAFLTMLNTPPPTDILYIFSVERLLLATLNGRFTFGAGGCEGTYALWLEGTMEFLKARHNPYNDPLIPWYSALLLLGLLRAPEFENAQVYIPGTTALHHQLPNLSSSRKAAPGNKKSNLHPLSKAGLAIMRHHVR